MNFFTKNPNLTIWRRGLGVCGGGEGVNDFFTIKSKSKLKKKFFLGGGVGGRGLE